MYMKIDKKDSYKERQDNINGDRKYRFKQRQERLNLRETGKTDMKRDRKG